ncbi:MFS transporter [Paenibacillus gorillae]|uniref:MFS transporter n=1 Tax=Paenibacillus gorillae TaxID=1243662 RepID=UPI0004AEF822|nr:MFS transporter [Paenibacillus gorillae]
MNISNSTGISGTAAANADTGRLPWAALLALAMAAFICIFTETIPAGLLPQISEGLAVSEGMAGQLVTLYAIGSVAAAIPLTTATRGWRRKPLLLTIMMGFFLFNSATALSSTITMMLIARFFAGVCGGVLWGMAAGYARRMVPDVLKGRAMAVAMVGAPVAMALGVPAGTLLGTMTGWRAAFGVMSLLTLLLVAWIIWKMPDFAGQLAEKRLPLPKVFLIKGVRPVLAVVLIWVLAHNILYTYIAPYLAGVGLAGRVDLILLIFGVTSIAGIWIVGMYIDRQQRSLVLISLAGFALASLLFGIGSNQPLFIYLAVAVWGLTFGGAGTLLQTAIAEAAGDSADIAQSMLVTSWNLAIGAGGLTGALLLGVMNVRSFPWVLLILILAAWLITYQSKKYGFTTKQTN